MTIDFDRRHERLHTASVKWDLMRYLFGGEDLIPLWVADMDFQAPEAVVEALTERAKQGIYGYTSRPQSYYDAVTSWLKERHGWEIPQTSLSTSPSVLNALSVCLSLLTAPGDGVLIQTPVYNAFHEKIPLNDRVIVENPLLFENGRYTMDFADLEQKLASGSAKVVVLCNPHNPVGRVWERDELQQLGEICLKHQVPVITDEIHFDLILPGHTHTMFGSLSEAFAQNSITLFSPTKTFNIAGLHTSMAIIPNATWRSRFKRQMQALNIDHESYFALTATEAVYTKGAAWLDELLVYLQGNLERVTAFCAAQMPKIRVIKPEGTYLVWLDCRELGMNAQQIKDWMYREAKVALSEGSTFGQAGEGFLRMNIACPRVILEEGLQRMQQAYDRLKK